MEPLKGHLSFYLFSIFYETKSNSFSLCQTRWKKKTPQSVNHNNKVLILWRCGDALVRVLPDAASRKHTRTSCLLPPLLPRQRNVTSSPRLSLVSLHWEWDHRVTASSLHPKVRTRHFFFFYNCVTLEWPDVICCCCCCQRRLAFRNKRKNLLSPEETSRNGAELQFSETMCSSCDRLTRVGRLMS